MRFGESQLNGSPVRWPNPKIGGVDPLESRVHPVAVIEQNLAPKPHRRVGTPRTTVACVVGTRANSP